MRIRGNPKAVVLGMIVISLLAGALYLSRLGRRGEGIADVQIPPETKDYLVRLGQRIGDLRFIKKDGSIRDRTNRDDNAEADSRGFLKRESDNFIVYFRSGDRIRGDAILRLAEASKERMRAVFEYFPYANVRNGLKLPIYLAASQEEYHRLSGARISSAGCVVTIVYNDGLIATMYLSPEAFLHGDVWTKQVIVHEVAHYTHFCLVELKNIRNLRVWFTEGLASYTAQENDRIHYLHSVFKSGRVIPLTVLSSYSDEDAYSSPDILLFYAEGQSVLNMIEEKYGARSVTTIVLAVSRRTTIEGAMQEVIRLSLVDLNRTWFSYLSKIYASARTETFGGFRPLLAIWMAGCFGDLLLENYDSESIG